MNKIMSFDTNNISPTIKDSSLDAILTAIQTMKNSRLRNYIAPGLTSHLIGGEGFGKVRLFTAERTTMEFITPHDHRYDFTCWVLRGAVHNTLFKPNDTKESNCEVWSVASVYQHCHPYGPIVHRLIRTEAPSYWYTTTETYKAGSTYSMKHSDIHSIKFDRGTEVLFFEGPECHQSSRILEPWEDGKVVPTFRKENWMYQKDTP